MKTFTGKLTFLVAFLVAATLLFLALSLSAWFFLPYLLGGSLLFWLAVRGVWQVLGSTSDDVVILGVIFSIFWLLLVGAWLLLVWHEGRRRTVTQFVRELTAQYSIVP